MFFTIHMRRCVFGWRQTSKTRIQLSGRHVRQVNHEASPLTPVSGLRSDRDVTLSRLYPEMQFSMVCLSPRTNIKLQIHTRKSRGTHDTPALAGLRPSADCALSLHVYTDPPDTHTHAHALLSRSLRPKGPHDYPNTPPCTLRPALGATSINDVVADSVAISHLGHSLTTGDAEMPASCHVWPTRSCAGG